MSPPPPRVCVCCWRGSSHWEDDFSSTIFLDSSVFCFFLCSDHQTFSTHKNIYILMQICTMPSALSGDLGTQRWVSLCWWSSTKGSSPRKGSNIDAESTWPVWSLCKDFRRTWWRGCSLRDRFIFLSLASPHKSYPTLGNRKYALSPSPFLFCLSFEKSVL